MTGYLSRIDGREIVCRFRAETDLAAPVFCFSLMAPARVVEGGELLRSVGGYAEVALPDLKSGVEHELRIAHENVEYRPVNRAWLPLGPYLRHAGGIENLTPGPAGAKAWEGIEGAEPDGLLLLPPPKSWEPAGGFAGFETVATGDRQFASVDALAGRLGLGAFVDAAGMPVGTVHATELAPEAYQVEIRDDRIEVRAGGEAGLFHAGVTLLNLTRLYRGRVPCGRIEDAPRFAWRGQHLDCARHFFQPETVEAFLDLLALFKINRFHWHFADDEAFRLEVQCFPQLWQETAFRGEGCAIPGVFGGGARAGGSYSLEFTRSLIARAKDLHIEIMPEVEVPAHALALNAVLDGLRDPADTGREVSVQGYHENTINPAMPRTWEVVRELVAEVAGIFPFEVLHLGGDELPEGTWDGSPAVDALKAEKGLETRDDVMGWMMHEIAAGVVALGKRPAAWEEAARGKNGGLGHDALLFSWSGQGPGIEAAKAGYEIVMCPGQNTYLDMAHSGAPEDWGASWAAFIPVRETVNWNPVPGALGDAKGKVLGVQGAFWGEFTTSDDEMNNMVWPRILGVASQAWGCDFADRPEAFEALASCYQSSVLGRIFARR